MSRANRIDRQFGRGVLLATLAILGLAASWSAAAQAPKLTAAADGLTDAMFQEPYIDTDEWRDQPSRHRYVHGGFKGTKTRFSFYLPPKERYEGRFFQYITPVPDSETVSQNAQGEDNRIGFTLASGAYFIETNGGGAGMSGGPGNAVEDSTIAAYRANAASAQYSRIVATKMYGGKRPYGYAFGGSGGGYRTVGGMENTEGVWDGAVPFVLGSPMAIPNMFTVRMYAQRVLADKLAQVADAADVGGSGDIYAGLQGEQRAALVEITRMGFPPRGWHSWKVMGMGAFPVLYPGIVAADPTYFTDFWSKPGYEGFQPPKSLVDARIQYKAKIVQLILAEEANRLGLKTSRQMGEARGTANSAWQVQLGPEGKETPVAIRIDGVPSGASTGIDLLVNTGAIAGQRLAAQRRENDIVILGRSDPKALGALKVGDEVQLDNSNFLAAQTYHRHQVPGADYPAWDQFRGPDGKPIYPQRPMLIGPIFTKATSGSVNNGHFHGKMILVENMMDIDALPWQGDWYRAKAKEALGDKLDDNFRLWYADRANHSDSSRQVAPTQTVSYLGVLHQALRDLSAWVEKGVVPPATTNYKIVDAQVEVPATAAERKGIQPVVTLTANGGVRTEVGVGEAVALSALVETPPGAGRIVSAQWDLEGAGDFPVIGKLESIDAKGERATVKLTHAFTKAGTYFPTLRVASQRQGDAATPYARIQNLARVRIIVR